MYEHALLRIVLFLTPTTTQSTTDSMDPYDTNQQITMLKYKQKLIIFLKL